MAVFPPQRFFSFLGLSLFSILIKIFVADLHHLALSRVQRHLSDLPYGLHTVSLDGDQISRFELAAHDKRVYLKEIKIFFDNYSFLKVLNKRKSSVLPCSCRS